MHALFVSLRMQVHQNILSVQGFIAAVQFVLQLEDGGGIFSAPVCSSWVWMNRSTSGRHSALPAGNDDHFYVRMANIMVSRVCMLCWLALGCGKIWMIEQPRFSILECSRRMQELIQKTRVFRTTTSLGHFGAPTQKDIYLYSNYDRIDNVKHFAISGGAGDASKKLVRTKLDASGKQLVTGNPSELKDSQAYPPAFGRAILMLHHGFFEEQKQLAYILRSQSSHCKLHSATDLEDQWADAALDGVFSILEIKRSPHMQYIH